MPKVILKDNDNHVNNIWEKGQPRVCQEPNHVTRLASLGTFKEAASSMHERMCVGIVEYFPGKWTKPKLSGNFHFTMDFVLVPISGYQNHVL